MDKCLSKDSNFDSLERSSFKNFGFSSSFFTLKANKSGKGLRKAVYTVEFFGITFDDDDGLEAVVVIAGT